MRKTHVVVCSALLFAVTILTQTTPAQAQSVPEGDVVWTRQLDRKSVV